MRLRTLWVDYSEREGELMPTCMAAVDEYLDDSNPDFWYQELEKYRKEAEVGGFTWRIIDFELPEAVVAGAFKILDAPLEGGVVVDGN